MKIDKTFLYLFLIITIIELYVEINALKKYMVFIKR